MNSQTLTQQVGTQVITNIFGDVDFLTKKIETLKNTYGKPLAVKNINEALNCTKQGCGSSWA